MPELCRKHGMSDASFHKWRSKYGGMDVSMMTRLKELEGQNRRLKRMYAESKMDANLPRVPHIDRRPCPGAHAALAP